jgi:hypothetical protein
MLQRVLMPESRQRRPLACLSQRGEMPRQPSARSPYSIRPSSSLSYRAAGKNCLAGVRNNVYWSGTCHQSQQKRSLRARRGSPILQDRQARQSGRLFEAVKHVLASSGSSVAGW